MTRAEAAQICQSVKFILENSDYTEAVEEALDMAMEALVQEETLQSLTKPNKSDLISRQAAIDALDEIESEVADGYGYQYEKWRKYFCGLPSAQPEIIRCKDCIYWREGTSFSYCDKLHGMGVLDALDYMTAEDDYCSMAERREE